MLLDEIDALSAKIDTLTLRIDQLIADIPAAKAPDPGQGRSPRQTRSPPRFRPSRDSTRSPASGPTPPRC